MKKGDKIWMIYEYRFGSHIISVSDKPQHVRKGDWAIQKLYDGEIWHEIEDTRIEGEYFENTNRTIECTINYLQDHTNNRDLDSDYHKGFTIGKGRNLYWEMIWHGSGNVTVYSTTTGCKRYIAGDSKITIHFK